MSKLFVAWYKRANKLALHIHDMLKMSIAIQYMISKKLVISRPQVDDMGYGII